jgi:hypothetical protein
MLTKKSWISLCIMFIMGLTHSYAQGKFEFSDNNDTYDFGTAIDGAKVEHTYEFTNVGNAPIQIFKAEAGCSCTTVDWTKTPVLPGKKGTVKVVFNTEGKVGPAYKEITIASNAQLAEKNKKRYTVIMKGTVKAK